VIDVVSVLGFIGSITAASLFYPQVWTSYKTKSTKDLSWFTIIVGMVNGLLWTAYGALKADPFLYVTNAILFTGVFLLFMLKERHG
jgi:MtN3 and saliva related transmembrane protein